MTLFEMFEGFILGIFIAFVLYILIVVPGHKGDNNS